MVDAIVLTKNSSQTLKSCLDAISKQTVPCRVIVVDAESTDGSIDIAEKYGALVVQEPKRPLPWIGNNCSAARNAGLKASTSKLVVFVDADVIIPPQLIERLSLYVTGNVAGVTSGEQDRDSPFQKVMRIYRTHARKFTRKQEVLSIATYCALYRRQALDSVGGFDETLYGGEDWDLNYRLRRHGWILLGVPEQPVLHLDRPNMKSFAKQMYHYAWARARITRQKKIVTPIYALPTIALSGLVFLFLSFGAHPLFIAGFLVLGVTLIKSRVAAAFVLMQVAWAVGYLHGLLS